MRIKLEQDSKLAGAEWRVSRSGPEFSRLVVSYYYQTSLLRSTETLEYTNSTRSLPRTEVKPLPVAWLEHEPVSASFLLLCHPRHLLPIVQTLVLALEIKVSVCSQQRNCHACAEVGAKRWIVARLVCVGIRHVSKGETRSEQHM